MSRRFSAVICACAASLIHIGISGADVLPTGSAPHPIRFRHFPDRLHTFVWRNWELVSLERMAKILDTTPEKVRRIGQSMGLPRHIRPPVEYQQRGYISIIRRNWHILPYGFNYRSYPSVFRPKIVTPFRNAMCFINSIK